MAGYFGYSMSNNAIEAYYNGEMPLSKWTKKAILEAIDNIDCLQLHFNKELLKKVKLSTMKRYFLEERGYHHTSSYYNETTFYGIDALYLENCDECDILKLSQLDKKTKEEKVVRYNAEVQVWGGSRKHPRLLGTKIVNGIVKGDSDYLVCEDGTRYKLSAKKTLRVWKSEE